MRMSADERSGTRSIDGDAVPIEQLVDQEAMVVVPVVEERLVVSKRPIEGERVRVRVVTDEIAELARVSLRSEHIEVERVPVGRTVETAPPVREEDGVTVIPIVEEIVVVEKRLVLKEELHVRRVPSTRYEEQPVTLRRQRAEIERLPPGSGPARASQPKQGEHP